MPIAIPPPTRPSFALSTARSETIDSISKTEVNFLAHDLPKVLDKLRKKITYMGPFDHFVSWACKRNKEASLELVANKVIADLELAWAVRTHQPEADIRALEDARHEPHNKFAAILSNQGLATLLEHSDISATAGATQFTPNTGDQDNASLLSLTLNTRDAVLLLEKFDGAKKKAESYLAQAKDNSNSHADKAGFYRVAGLLFAASKRYVESREAMEESAKEYHRHGVETMQRFVSMTSSEKLTALLRASQAEAQAAEAYQRAAEMARVGEKNKGLAHFYGLKAGEHIAMEEDPFTEYVNLNLIRERSPVEPPAGGYDNIPLPVQNALRQTIHHK